MSLSDGRPDMKPALAVPTVVAPAKSFHETWAFRFLGLPIIGAILGGLCPLLPPPAQVVCVAIAGVVKQIPAAAYSTDTAPKDATK